MIVPGLLAWLLAWLFAPLLAWLLVWLLAWLLAGLLAWLLAWVLASWGPACTAQTTYSYTELGMRGTHQPMITFGERASRQ